MGFRSDPARASSTPAPTIVLQLYRANRPILSLKGGEIFDPRANAVTLAGSGLPNLGSPHLAFPGGYDPFTDSSNQVGAPI